MKPTHVSRQQRVVRGFVGAIFTVVFAATSHTITGGTTPSLLGLFGSLMLATMLCTVFGGRHLSLWRTSTAVLLSQALFHFFFSYLVVPSSAPGSPAMNMGVHDHSAGIASLMSSQTLTASGPGSTGTGMIFSSDEMMLLAHALAAVATIVMIRRGEVALARIARLVTIVIIRPLTSALRPVALPLSVPTVSAMWVNRFNVLLQLFSSLRYRGPPARSAVNH